MEEAPPRRLTRGIAKTVSLESWARSVARTAPPSSPLAYLLPSAEYVHALFNSTQFVQAGLTLLQRVLAFRHLKKERGDLSQTSSDAPSTGRGVELADRTESQGANGTRGWHADATTGDLRPDLLDDAAVELSGGMSPDEGEAGQGLGRTGKARRNCFAHVRSSCTRSTSLVTLPSSALF